MILLFFPQGLSLSVVSVMYLVRGCRLSCVCRTSLIYEAGIQVPGAEKNL